MDIGRFAVKAVDVKCTKNFIEHTEHEYHVIDTKREGLQAVMAICKSYTEAESFRKGVEAGYLQAVQDEYWLRQQVDTQSENAGVTEQADVRDLTVALRSY